MGKYIPQMTLHREIHSKIHDVPTPNGKECKIAYDTVRRLEKEGLINVKDDSLEQRIDLLLKLWDEACPTTCAVLRWQKEVISKFFAKKPKEPPE